MLARTTVLEAKLNGLKKAGLDTGVKNHGQNVAALASSYLDSKVRSWLCGESQPVERTQREFS